MGLLLWQACAAYAQTDSLSILQLEVEQDLLHLKPEERIFNQLKGPDGTLRSPHKSTTTTFVLTGGQLTRAGVNTLGEALRLLPGFLVRDNTNGNYHVQQGMLNFAVQGGLRQGLMPQHMAIYIDDVPVQGGGWGEVNWEALPLTLLAIDRIEVPQSPDLLSLRANSAHGIVRIYTQRKQDATPSVHMNSQLQLGEQGAMGFSHQLVGHTPIGKRTFLNANAHWERRDRSSERVYVQGVGFVPVEDLLTYEPTADLTHRHLQNAQDRLGAQLNARHVWSAEREVEVNAFHQQSASSGLYTPIELISMTRRINRQTGLGLRAQWDGWELQLSHQQGYMDPTTGYIDPIDTRYTQGAFDYRFRRGKWLLVPGLRLERQHYDMAAPLGDLQQYQAFAKAEWQPSSRWLLQANLSVVRQGVESQERNLHQHAVYPMFSLGASYQVDDYQSWRLQLSESREMPNLYQLYWNYPVQSLDGTTIQFHALDQVLMPRTRTIELGYRYGNDYNTTLDLSLLHKRMQGALYTTLLPQIGVENAWDAYTRGLGSQLAYTALGGAWTQKMRALTLRAHATFQVSHFGDPLEKDQAFAPAFIGGINLTQGFAQERGSFFVGYYLTSSSGLRLNDQRTTVPGVSTLDARVSYRVWKQLRAHLNARHLLGRSGAQLPQADAPFTQLWGGLYLILQ